MNFDQAFEALLGHEGRYSDHPADNGGKTMFGVTEAVARRAGWRGDMRDLPLDLAKRIYRAEYWDAARCDDLPERVRFDVFDTAVNAGVGTAIKFVQRAVDVDADGVFGPKTLDAVKQIHPLVLLVRLNGARLSHLASLPDWPAFGRGWANRIAANLSRTAL